MSVRWLSVYAYQGKQGSTATGAAAGAAQYFCTMVAGAGVLLCRCGFAARPLPLFVVCLQHTLKAFTALAPRSPCSPFRHVCLTSSAHILAADLIDVGWRRSGDYLYKPNLQTSCCKAGRASGRRGSSPPAPVRSGAHARPAITCGSLPTVAASVAILVLGPLLLLKLPVGQPAVSAAQPRLWHPAPQQLLPAAPGRRKAACRAVGAPTWAHAPARRGRTPTRSQRRPQAYTIRLDTTLFAPDQGQRRLLRRWRDFLAQPAFGTAGGSRGCPDLGHATRLACASVPVLGQSM
jgi:hypothetical protein